VTDLLPKASGEAASQSEFTPPPGHPSPISGRNRTMARLARRNLWARKGRLAVMVATIVAGVAFMAGSFVLTDTLRRSFDNLFSDTYRNTNVVVQGERTIGASFTQVPLSLGDTIAAVDGVAAVEPAIQGIAQIQVLRGPNEGKIIGASSGAPPFGRNWLTNTTLNPWVVAEGRPPQAAGEISIDRSMAKRGQIAVGDRVQLITDIALEEVTVVGINLFGREDAAVGTSTVFVTLDESVRLFKRGEPSADGFNVLAEPGVSDGQLAGRVRAVVDVPGVETLTGAEYAKELQERFGRAIGFFATFLQVFAAIALFTGVFVIWNAFNILITQRIRELALLRAIGATVRQVRRSVLWEAFGIGVIGSAIGVGAGVALAWLLRVLIGATGFKLPDDPLVVMSRTVWLPMVVGVVVTLVAAFAPIRRVSKVSPLAALRDGSIDRSNAARWRPWLALTGLAGAIACYLISNQLTNSTNASYMVGASAVAALLAIAIGGPWVAIPMTRALAALVLPPNGITKRLAERNAMRNPRRTASTALALVIGVGIITGTTVITTSLRDSVSKLVTAQFTGDVVVSSTTWFLPLAPSVPATVAADPTVEVSAPSRDITVRVNGIDAEGTATTPAVIGEVIDLESVRGDMAAIRGTSIGLSEEFAASHSFELGQTVSGLYADGSNEDLQIVAIYTGDIILGNIVVEDAYIVPKGETDGLRRVFVQLRDGVSDTEGRDSIGAALKALPTAQSSTKEEFIESRFGTFNNLLQLVNVLLALSVLIALLGIANTLGLSVIERTREIGLFRAVGGTRRQLKRMIRWEASFVALVGTLVGIVWGSVFGSALVLVIKKAEDLDDLNVVIPGGRLLVFALIGALIGLAAAFFPGRRAAKLDVLKAIATD
jgi:putative ABC transport system permease protein